MDDPLRYGPRPEDLVPRDGGARAGNGAAAGGIYRPPKLNPVAMEVYRIFPSCSLVSCAVRSICERSPISASAASLLC